MLNTLIKKQYQEYFRSYFVNPKTQKRRSKLGIAGMFVLFAVIMLFLAAMFFGMSFLVGDQLLASGLDWLYFVLMGIMAILLGTFGSVFNTYSTLYLAKDNEMLLSMPIPPSKILITRMSLVYGMSLLYSGIVWIPAMVYAWIFGNLSPAAVVFDVLLVFLVALFVTVITCVLGWVVAVAASHIRNKSFVVVVLSLVFIGGYYYVCMNWMNLLQQLLLNAEALGEGFRVWANVLYQLGRAAAGDGKAMAIFTGITLVLFLLCFVVLSKSFLRIATRNKGEAKKTGKVTVKSRGLSSTLLQRELRHFVSSPTYMLNCGLGAVILPVLSVFALIKRELLTEVISGLNTMIPGIGGAVPMAVVLIVTMCCGLNAVSTPSVSLEGKSLWILRTLPVSGKMVLRAKLKLHLWVNLPAALFSTIVLGFCLEMEPVIILLCCLCNGFFIWFSGTFGLMISVLRPDFQWTSEALPIKQSMNMMISLVLSFALPILAAVGCYFGRKLCSTEVYVLLFAALLAILSILLTRWLDTKGGSKFDSL